MRALLVLIVIGVIAYFAWQRNKQPAVVKVRPPAIERPVSSLDPKTAIDRAKAVAEKVEKERAETDIYGRK